MGKKLAVATAGAMLAGLISFGAEAFPVTSQSNSAAPGVTLVADGCGIGWHRGPGGRCHPNGGPVVVAPAPVVVAPAPAVVVAPAPVVVGIGGVCPPGTHLGRGGRRCWPN